MASTWFMSVHLGDCFVIFHILCFTNSVFHPILPILSERVITDTKPTLKSLKNRQKYFKTSTAPFDTYPESVQDLTSGSAQVAQTYTKFCSRSGGLSRVCAIWGSGGGKGARQGSVRGSKKVFGSKKGADLLFIYFYFIILYTRSDHPW